MSKFFVVFFLLCFCVTGCSCSATFPSGKFAEGERVKILDVGAGRCSPSGDFDDTWCGKASERCLSLGTIDKGGSLQKWEHNGWYRVVFQACPASPRGTSAITFVLWFPPSALKKAE